MSALFPGLPLLLGFAFASNVPLGYLREKTVRFSWQWFLCVHISIPLIILLRIWLGYTWKLIPLTLGFAILGQVAGGRLQRRRRE